MHRLMDLISKFSAFHRFYSSHRFLPVLGMKAFTGFIRVSSFHKFVDYSGFLAYYIGFFSWFYM